MSCPDPVPAALAFENVSWGSGILHPVSFEVRPGRVLGVLGPNGAGKSSLLRLIYRFHRPQTGRVLIDGTDITTLSHRAVARRVAAVLQEQPTDFALTVALSPAQLSMLLEGIDWRAPERTWRPLAAG